MIQQEFTTSTRTQVSRFSATEIEILLRRQLLDIPANATFELGYSEEAAEVFLEIRVTSTTGHVQPDKEISI